MLHRNGAIPVQIGGTIPRGRAASRDQLRRAAFYVPLIIAEAVGRASEADGARPFAVARGSAVDFTAVLDVVRALGAPQDEPFPPAFGLLARVVAMLTTLVPRE